MKCFYIHYFVTDNGKRGEKKPNAKSESESDIEPTICLQSLPVIIVDTIYIFDYIEQRLKSFTIHFHDFFRHGINTTFGLIWFGLHSIFTNLKNMSIIEFFFLLSSIVHQNSNLLKLISILLIFN